jgi:hypothetical protein
VTKWSIKYRVQLLSNAYQLNPVLKIPDIETASKSTNAHWQEPLMKGNRANCHQLISNAYQLKNLPPNGGRLHCLVKGGLKVYRKSVSL